MRFKVNHIKNTLLRRSVFIFLLLTVLPITVIILGLVKAYEGVKDELYDFDEAIKNCWWGLK